MNPSVFPDELSRNRATYERLKGQIACADFGQYATIANGRLMAVTDSFDDGLAAVQALQPAPEHFLVFPVDEEPAFDLIDDFPQV
jgi:hypothetical protein